MKSRHALLFAALIAAAIASFASNQSYAQQANVEATLIFASSDGSSFDPALKRYESNLKRIFKYTSYKLQGKSSTRVSIPGKSTINLGSGHSVEISAQPSDGRKLRLNVRWSNGRQLLLNTTFNKEKGQPIVLGGPSAPSRNGNLILILVPR